MRLSRIFALCGPNVWSRKPVLEVWLTGATEMPVARHSCRDEFRCLGEWWIAACAAAGNAADDHWRIAERLRPSGQPGEAFAALALGLQALAGTAVAEHWIECEGPEQPVCVAVEFVEEPVARLAVSMAHGLVWGARCGEFPDPADLVREIRTCAGETCFGTTTRAIVAAARGRGIPVSRVDDDCLLQLGHGARQQRIQGAITGRAGFLAELVSRDKLLTKRLLRQLRLPTAEGRLVRSAADAWAAACEIGLPVVVKPRNADYGNGVSLDLMTEAQVMAACDRARECRPEVLVERQLAGVPHRLFVVNDAVVAAARREPAHVVGDGRQSVSALIDEANRDPRRGDSPDVPLYPISVDPPLVSALAKQELRLDSVPAAGRIVNLQLDPSECRAETILDVTDRVHPDVSAVAIDAVRAVGLDVAGVDIVAVDIGRPLEEQGGGILEVNAGPAIYLHRSPQCRPERPVAEAIVESLFAPGDTGRIPLIVVLGDVRAASVARLIARFIDDGTRVVGMAGRDGIVIGARRMTAAPAADFAGCRAVLAHPRAELAICELSGESLRNEGLAFDECTVAVLAGFDAPATGPGCARGRTRIMRVLAEIVAAGGLVVANVEDADVAAACAPGDPGLVAVALDPEHPFLAEHRRRGGRAIFGDGSRIMIADCEGEAISSNEMAQVASARERSAAATMDILLAYAAICALKGIGHGMHSHLHVLNDGKSAPTEKHPF